MFELARAYASEGMAAYSELQEARVRGRGARLHAPRKHQREVGTGYFDEVAQVISRGTAQTLALEGSTEKAQFV